MAEGLILEFEGVGVDQYNAVNDALDIDLETGRNAPPGLLFHAGGAKPGGWVVFEIWASKADQAAFMSGRLGAALQQGGITAPPARVEWLEVARHISLPG